MEARDSPSSLQWAGWSYPSHLSQGGSSESTALSSQKKGVQGLYHNTPVSALSLGEAVGGRAQSDSAPVDKGAHLTLFKVDLLGSSSR